MLMLPKGSETNQLAVLYPEFSIFAKILIIIFVINGAFGKYESRVVLVGLIAGAVGLGANLSVLVANWR